MKATLQLLLSALAATSCLGDPASVRNFFLPLWYEGEASQTCHLHLQGLRSPVIRINHNCPITLERDVIAATNGQADVCFTADLKKIRQGSAFAIQVFGMGGSSQLDNLEQEWHCHASLVPFKVQAATHGNRFALTNLTSEPFRVEQSKGVAFEEVTPSVVRGTFEEGAYVKLQSQGKITLNKEQP